MAFFGLSHFFYVNLKPSGYLSIQATYKQQNDYENTNENPDDAVGSIPRYAVGFSTGLQKE